MGFLDIYIYTNVKLGNQIGILEGQEFSEEIFMYAPKSVRDAHFFVHLIADTESPAVLIDDQQ